jgi:hypothetical protein
MRAPGKPRGPDCAGTYNLLLLGGLLEQSRPEIFESTSRSPDVSRRGAIRDDIARRIKRVCADLNDQEFTTLVDQMTERQLKGERRANSF